MPARLAALAALPALAAFSPPIAASQIDSNCLKEGFLPANRLNIPVDATHGFSANGITEARFNQLLDKVENFYRPVVSQQGASLQFLRYWTDGTVNAYADRTGNQWYVKMFGGLARHDAITEDGLTLVACHEVGHHLGGAPKYRGQWAANEGQADYFATLKCLRNIFQNDNNVEIVRQMQVDPSVTRSCERSFGDAASIALCVRSAVAGQSSAMLMRALANSGPISFTTPDPARVAVTYDQHPAAQCRLDTYLGGAICQVDKSEPLSNSDPTAGTCSSEKNFVAGVRPLCWYKPQGTGGPDPVPPSPSGIARPPLLAGQTLLVSSNPNATIPVDYDVSEFQGAAGAYIEVSAINRELANPNGTQPDPARLGSATQAGTRGRLFVTPVQGLPQGWGTYSFRVIPLNSAGNQPVGRFSNSSKLVMRRP